MTRTAGVLAAILFGAAAIAGAEGVSSMDSVATAEDVSSTDSTATALEYPVMSPETAKALVEAADFEACDEYKAALAILMKAYDGGAREADLFESLTAVELKCNLVADAAKHVGEARKLYPADARFILWSAVAASAAKRDAEAAALVGEGLKTAGENELALYDLSERFLRRGVLSVAAAIYKKINAIYPKDSMFDLFSYLHLTAYYGLTDRPAESARILSGARMAFEYAEVSIMTMQECDYLAKYFGGMAAVRAGDLTGGINMLRDAAAAYPEGLVADGEIVKTLDAAGKKEEADGVYGIVSTELNEKIGDAQEKAAAWYDLAFFAAATGRKSNEGLEAAEWALRLAPLRPEYLAVRAELLATFGREDEALIDLERALVLVSMPRWAEPGQYDEMMWRRMELVEKMGKGVTAAFRRMAEAGGNTATTQAP